MSDIFYSEVDKNLQLELSARAEAGRWDRSEQAIRYMTEKVAGVRLTAYAEGSKRDKTKIVHILGGKTVLTDEFLPGGDYGYLSNRPYTLKETSWAASLPDGVNYNGETKINVDLHESSKTFNNTSFRIPPHITSAEFQTNDSSRAITNKATVNIIIPNPDRDLNFMESMYARPGRYCLLEFEHPDSAIMSKPATNGRLTENAFPSFAILKEQFPETAAEFNNLRRMNAVQFEGVITSFEYAYQTDGTISMTVYLLGTSMVYSDLSLIMQTKEEDEQENEIEVSKAKTFYKVIAERVKIAKEKTNPDKVLNFEGEYVDATSAKSPNINQPKTILYGKCGDGTYREYINLNNLMDILNAKINTKLQQTDSTNKKGKYSIPGIITSHLAGVWSNRLDALCSSNPDEILIPRRRNNNRPRIETDSDCYGSLRINRRDRKVGVAWINTDTSGFYMDSNEQKDYVNAVYDQTKDDTDNGKRRAKMESYKILGRPGCILINLTTIEAIITEISANKDTFTVKNFLKKISEKISNATGGAINLQLVTDPVFTDVLYFRDINWVGLDIKGLQPYQIPMFANHPLGTIVRDFKFSAKLPSNVQSLMYTLNSTKDVSEEQIAPYVRFMYSNAAVSRSGENNSTETSTYGNPELIKKLAEQYLQLHKKYYNNLFKARDEFGKNLTSEKQAALADALRKYVQYPKPTIEESSTDGIAPVFPFDVEFTIDGINGLRYGDILDFPGLPAKYKNQTTFSVKSIAHTVSNAGEWTTRITCIMRPKF